MSSSPPSPPHGPDASFCDPGVDPPCFLGLGVWVWVLLILGLFGCVGAWLVFFWMHARRGNTPGQLAKFAEAVFFAAHSHPNDSRLHGRAASSHPCIDLLEAQNCCCCLPLSLGLLLLGVIDCTRLALGIVYAADSIVIYTQTDPDDAAAAYAGLMVPVLRQNVEGYLWPCLLNDSIKVLLWTLVALTVCWEMNGPIQLLLAWLPVDLAFTVVFAVFNSQSAEELCQVDLRVYAASGHVGFRRNYLSHLPPGPLLLDARGVPDVCLTFWRQEVAVAAGDCVGCAILSWCIFYIGVSRMRSWDRASGPIRGGLQSV